MFVNWAKHKNYIRKKRRIPKRMDSNRDGTAMGWPASESTSDPNLTVSMITEEVPTLTIATIVGLIVIMIIAIAAVFLLGVLIDCRQQRLIEKKMGQAKRLKTQRRVNTSEDDAASIANNMEQPGMSAPPAEVITHAP